ncbi:MAG: sulfotransferase [Reichenbachiella sp.]|uniref:sulfotransferase n=1 Tax=Reichenbachiella sp. TaxID=2184521 RepID=UPI0032677CEF
MEGKILGIGLQRTGTTTLYHALNILGVRAAPHSIPLFSNSKDGILTRFDAFMDNPIPLLYRELDQQLSGCKFILTTRAQEQWLKSVQWLFEKELQTLKPELRKIADQIHVRFYGTTLFDHQIFSDKWISYHEEVSLYFKYRQKDLLVLDLDKNLDWDPLCEFLDRKIPKKPFPHENRSA